MWPITQRASAGLWNAGVVGDRSRSAHPAYSGRMRFERIFEDLEGQFAHHREEEIRAVSEELTRAERARLTLADRLRGAQQRRLTLHLATAVRVAGIVQEVGPDWVVLSDGAGTARAVVPLAAVGVIDGLSPRARPAEESLLSPLGLGAVLREIARDRSVVRCETTAGTLVGRIAAVGADSLDLRPVPTGESTVASGSSLLTIATSALLVLRHG